MKRVTKHISSIFLLTVFLLATTGVSISKHVCELTGHADVAFFTVEDFTGCCEKDKDCTSSSNEKPGCCSDEQNYVKADIIKKHEEQSDVKLELPVLNTAELSFAATQTPANPYTYSSYRALPPPPINGLDILIDKQVFRL